MISRRDFETVYHDGNDEKHSKMETKAVKLIRYNSRNSSLASMLTLLALLALGVIGCARNSTGIRVVALSNRHVLDLVQIKIGKKVEAVFAINLNDGDCVFISTRLRGNFIYNVDTGWLGGSGSR